MKSHAAKAETITVLYPKNSSISIFTVVPIQNNMAAVVMPLFLFFLIYICKLARNFY